MRRAAGVRAASQMACFLRSHHHMRQGASLASMSRNRVDAGSHPATSLRRFLTDSVRHLFSLPDDAKQALRMRRYFAAAGTSLLALGLLYACYLYGALPWDAFAQIG